MRHCYRGLIFSTLLIMRPNFKKLPFTLERKQIVDFLKIAKAKRTASVILEFDITGVRNQIRLIKRRTGKKSSLTGYLIHCYASAISEDKSIQAYRKGSNLIIFDDVDVSTMIEREYEGAKIPVAYVLRKANEKSIFEISTELEEAKNKHTADLMDHESSSMMQMVTNFAKRVGWLRRIFLAKIFKDPFMKKEFNGTVGFSSMGMFSYNLPGWAVPMTPQVLTAMVGGIFEKAEFVGGDIEKREKICITISMDHDILDGAQTARFIERFRKIIAAGVPMVEEYATKPNKSVEELINEMSV